MSVDRTSKLIAIIDDDEDIRDSLGDLMDGAGLVARCFGSAEEFLASDLHGHASCLILDIRMPKMTGLQLQGKPSRNVASFRPGRRRSAPGDTAA